MPLDATTSRPMDCAAAIAEAFAGIGRVDATAKPRRSVKDLLAWEYWVASLLMQLGESRRDKAKRAAVVGGVLPDHSKAPMAVGTAETVFAGAQVTIGVKVVKQSDRVDVAGLVADLQGVGVSPRVIKRLLKKHTRVFDGAHIFTCTLVSG